MKLIVDDVDEYNPTDISYAYSGYAPLSITLVQIIADKPAFISADGVDTAVKGKDGKGRVEERPRKQPIAGWSGYEETLKLLPGEVFDDVQPIEAGHENRTSCFYTLDTSSDADRLVKLSGQSLERTTTTLVFFLGGCTYTELSALRLMSQRSKGEHWNSCNRFSKPLIILNNIAGRRFLAATTGMINGTTLLDSLVPSVPITA